VLGDVLKNRKKNRSTIRPGAVFILKFIQNVIEFQLLCAIWALSFLLI